MGRRRQKQQQGRAGECPGVVLHASCPAHFDRTGVTANTENKTKQVGEPILPDGGLRKEMRKGADPFDPDVEEEKWCVAEIPSCVGFSAAWDTVPCERQCAH